VRTAAPSSHYSSSIRCLTVTQQPFARVNSVHHEWACVHVDVATTENNEWLELGTPHPAHIHTSLLFSARFSPSFFLKHPVNIAARAGTQILPVILLHVLLLSVLKMRAQAVHQCQVSPKGPSEYGWCHRFQNYYRAIVVRRWGSWLGPGRRIIQSKRRPARSRAAGASCLCLVAGRGVSSPNWILVLTVREPVGFVGACAGLQVQHRAASIVLVPKLIQMNRSN
jgi:hypothetical protein